MNSNQSKPRLVFLFLVFSFLYGILIINLYRIQIKQHAFYADRAEKQYNETITQTPPRAPIYDRNGQYLALNKESFAAFVLPKQCKDLESVRNFLTEHFPHAVERLDTHRTSNFVYIKRKLTDDEIKLIKESGLEDIYMLKEPHRFYPSSACATIVGLTDIDNKGVLGIEHQFNKLLSGTASSYLLERDARLGHYYFKKEVAHEGKTGQPIKLTIDSALQFLVEEEIKETIKRFDAQEAVAIVMDPGSGDILAMSHLPHFDPHNTQELNMEQTDNKAFSERHELGSVIKVFAALAALEEGIVKPDDIIDCENTRSTIIDGRKVNTVSAYGPLSFAEVIARSNNIGTAKVVKQLGTNLYDHYVRCGFTQKVGIPLPGEHIGFVNHPNNWSKQSIFSLSYGYEIAITLLELARAFCLIANNGVPVQPQLIKEPRDLQLKKENGQQLYAQSTINDIKNILEQTTVYGTARRAAVKGYRVMSKTGTANILENGVYVRNKTVLTCAGIIEKDNYQRVIVAFVKSAKNRLFAASVAAPLFERIAEKTVIHDKIV